MVDIIVKRNEKISFSQQILASGCRYVIISIFNVLAPVNAKQTKQFTVTGERFSAAHIFCSQEMVQWSRILLCG